MSNQRYELRTADGQGGETCLTRAETLDEILQDHKAAIKHGLHSLVVWDLEWNAEILPHMSRTRANP